MISSNVATPATAALVNVPPNVPEPATLEIVMFSVYETSVLLSPLLCAVTVKLVNALFLIPELGRLANTNWSATATTVNVELVSAVKVVASSVAMIETPDSAVSKVTPEMVISFVPSAIVPVRVPPKAPVPPSLVSVIATAPSTFATASSPS